MIARVQSLGSGGQAVALNEKVCVYLVAVIVRDLDLHACFPEIPETFPRFFSPGPLSRLKLANVPFLDMFERLVGLDPNADVYFESLAALHKARLKYERILETQPASGQGRWGEELEFPEDCRQSGYVPVLIVLDPTPSPKLDELRATFLNAGGEVYIGQDAWAHLEHLAGSTMARFLEQYVHNPLQVLLAEEPIQLPDLLLAMGDEHLTIRVGDEEFSIARVRNGVSGPRAWSA